MIYSQTHYAYIYIYIYQLLPGCTTTNFVTLCHYQGGSLTHSMLITVSEILTQSHWEPHILILKYMYMYI